MLKEKAITYAKDVISGKEITTKEVKWECKRFLNNLKRENDDSFLYFFDEKGLKNIEKLLKITNMATGIGVVGKSVYDVLHNFQAFFLVNVFGWKLKTDPSVFKHKEIILFIPRKNAKTFICALCLLILMLTEAKYSEFYSICIDRELASLVKGAMTQLIEASPVLKRNFKLSTTLSGKIKCLLTNNTYQARTAQANSNNGIRPSAFIADEIGAFKSYANIKAMESGQLSVDNPLQFKITTAYAEDQSIMLEELDYLKKIYSNIEKDDRLFCLLYYADKKNLWTEKGLLMSNPLRIEKNYESIRRMREKARQKSGETAEYLTKHMNHFIPTLSGEEYIDIEKVKACQVEAINFTGKDVYVGLDLAMTTDNVAVSIVAVDEDGSSLLVKSWAFIPREKVIEKSQRERTNYQEHIEKGNCFACGEDVIDYNFVEKFILDIEKKYQVNIQAIGYDRWNALATAQRLEEAGYTMVEIKQHSSVLHPTVKMVEEKILNKEFKYTENKLLVQNFQNARLIEDINKNKYVAKKKSTGKVDMVMALFNAVYLLNENEFLGQEFIFDIL